MIVNVPKLSVLGPKVAIPGPEYSFYGPIGKLLDCGTMKTRKKSLFLIFTPIDQRYKDADTHYSPSLTLVSLLNYLTIHFPDLDIKLLDGSIIFTQEEILAEIERSRPDVVAQSIQLISYRNALEIAKLAKKVGATTIVGGHQATQMRREIVKNQAGVIDFVVFGDGEIPLLALLDGSDVDSIPNIAYQSGGRYRENPPFRMPMGLVPVTDYSGIDLTEYRRLLVNSEFNKDASQTFLRIYSHKGCANRGNSTACCFCGRADQGVRLKTPKQYWDDILSVVNQNGADYVFDVGDDLLVSTSWLETLVAARPDNLRPYKVGVFGRANRVTAHKCQLLNRLSVTDVVIGFETGDENVMLNVGKKNTDVDTSVRAARLLFEHGIDVCASFVLGLPGECHRSLDATLHVAEDIVTASFRYRSVAPRELVANLIEPSPGSPVFRATCANFPLKYKGQDQIELSEIQYDYFRTFFGLTKYSEYEDFRGRLRDTALQMHRLVEFSDSQGWSQHELQVT